MMTYQQFYGGTEIPKCGRGSELKAIGARVQAAERDPNAANLIAVLTSAIAWGWKKGKKHGDTPTPNFTIRLRTVRQLVQEVTQDLTALGLDGQSIAKAALSFEKKKAAGKKGGLRALAKGYHFERKQFETAKKGGVDKATAINPKGGSYVHETMKAAVGLRTNMALQREAGANPQDTLALLISNPKQIKLLTTKHMENLSFSEYEEIFQIADNFGNQNTPEVNFVRKTDRVSKFLAWCERGLYYKQIGLPHSSGGREIYAMDKYGNLITMKPDVRFAPRTKAFDTRGTVQHNHSSLNAGNDVISAGEIEFLNGRITYISNESGHYKPTARDLQNCVTSLHVADDADLSQIMINCWDGTQMRPFNDAGIFLAARF